MKLSRFRMITFLALSLLVLVAVVAFGSWYAPFLGDAGIRLQHYLFQPLFKLGGQPITFFFILKTAIFLVVLTLASHFTMLVLQKTILVGRPRAPLGLKVEDFEWACVRTGFFPFRKGTFLQ